MSAILIIALPVFAVIGVGMGAGRLGVLTAADAGSLNRFVFNAAMPAALFGLMARAQPLTGDQLLFSGTYAAASMIVMFAAYGLGRRILTLGDQEAGAHAFASTLGNAVFLGLPIALAVPGWAENFVVLMLAEGVLVIAVGAAMMSPRDQGGLLQFAQRPFKNPLVIAMLAGLAFSQIGAFFGAALPQPVSNFFDILGRAAGPTALFSLGVFLMTTDFPPLGKVARNVAIIGAMKMIVLPILTLSGLTLLGLTANSFVGPAALFTLVPTAVGAYIMASQYQRYETETAAAVAVTTLLSIFSISAVLALFA